MKVEPQHLSDLKDAALYIAVPMIAKFEGCRLRAYQDSVGVWTIGYGHTHNVKSDDVITQQQADQMLRDEVGVFMDSVLYQIHVPVNEHQLAALTSFAYNLGVGALKKSTLLRKLNAGDVEGAAKEFVKWTKAGGHVLNGLVARRHEEAKEFMA
jgi:lysozyme